MSLYQIFLDNRGKYCQKWAHYFPIYEQHFSRFRNQAIVFYEIGVFRGGSLPMWKKWFGPLATIVGIDINPACKQFEERNCHVRIGSQSDHEFLTTIIREFGPPDIVLDDGSHMQKDLLQTFSFLFPNLKNNGVYLVEDAHACYLQDWGGGLRKPGTFIESCKEMIDIMHAWYYKPTREVGWLCQNLWSLTFYDSIIAFEKKRHGPPVPLQTPFTSPIPTQS